MTEKIIPEHIDPFRYAEQGLSLEGIVRLADMSRLQTITHTPGKVDVTLQFGIDEQGLLFVKGHLQTQLSLQCQRCMEAFVYEIISDFALGIVETLDEANDLPEHYEPAIVEEKKLALRDLIEEEIILNLPIIPKHPMEDCTVKLPLADSGWEEGKHDNPFQVLKTLNKSKQ